MDSSAAFAALLVIFLSYSETDAQEFCDGKYWCDTGHCCGKGRCCAYYYELWWFWLIWGVVILMSCCCLYQQRRIKQRHQQNLPHHAPTSGRCHLSFLTSLDGRLFPLPSTRWGRDCRLPSYEEAKQMPKGESPPAYESLFSQNTGEVPGAVTQGELPPGDIALPCQSCAPCPTLPLPPPPPPPSPSCVVAVGSAEDSCTQLSSPACSTTSDRAGLLENEEAEDVSPPPYSQAVRAPSS